MKVSIITVSFNSGLTISDTIASVACQSYPDIEYIVVDGGSKDDTLDIVQQNVEHISKWISEPDGGIYFGMNKGLEMATGDIIGIINSDDFFAYPEVIADVVDVFDQKSADAVYSDLVYVSENDVKAIKRRWISGEYDRKKFLSGWMPPHPTFFLKREHYKNFGKFNTDFRLAADYEIMLRMLYRHQLKAAYLPKVTVKMRMGGASNANYQNRIEANREDRKAWKLNQLKMPWYTSYLKPIRKVGQFIKR